MAMHRGEKNHNGDVSLVAPDNEAIKAANSENPEDTEWSEWRENATTQDDIHYFSIHYYDTLIGEIFLHDINLNARESLIGYRIFSGSNRGRGIGRKALQLLQDFVSNDTNLERLVIITAEDNIPSRRMAERCGFELVGQSWEDAHFVVYEWKSSQPKLSG